MRTKRPPRLAGFAYLGFYRYFLTICTEGRREHFRDVSLGRQLVDHFLQHAKANSFAVTAYCLMPDHLHALVKGKAVDANFRSLIRSWKQRTAYEWKQRTGERLWQEGYFDRVLRDEEGDLWVIHYIASNPVEARLVEAPEDYPLFGSTEYSWSDIRIAFKELAPWMP